MFFFKQKTAYEMRISDWSSDVCSSDLDRAFSEDPQVVAEFTRAYIRGMHEAGMAATIKHFPGHGTVREDTHFDDAVDTRTLDEMRASDLVAFAAGIEAGADAVMLAHVAYPSVAPEPAG